MLRKAISGIILSLLLISILTTAFNVQPGVNAQASDIIIDTEKGESRFTTYPDRVDPYYWVHVQDHDTFHTRAYSGNFWYTLCGEEGTGDPLYFGTWYQSLSQSGVYEVFVWIPNPDPFEYDGRVYTPTQSAIYQIYHKDGVAYQAVNQRLKTGGWYSVGTYTFDTSLFVILNDRTGEPYLSTMIAFDAIKFVLINNPPYTPSSPSPYNHATGVSIYTDLSWSGGDPDAGDTVTYDVYFGTSSSPPLVSNDQSATTYDPGTLSDGLIYYWKILATDNHGEPKEGPIWDFTTESVNQPPVASNLAISPSSPKTTDNLVGSYAYSDADGDPESGSEIRWYKDGVLQSTYNDKLTIPSSATAKGQVWYFTVKPRDGTDFGTLQTSPSVTIQNSPPTASVVDVTPDSPVTTDDLVCTITSPSTDPDGDTITYTYEWYKDGVIQNAETTVTTALTDTVSSTLTAEGQVWKCVVTPNDGMVNGISDEDQVTIVPPTSPPNQPPTLNNGYVTPSSGDTSTVFEYYVTYADPDGDAPTVKYVYIDGSPYTMTKIAGDYVSGATFKYSTTLPAGSHNYYFYFDDGHGHTVILPTSGTYPGPDVSPPPEYRTLTVYSSPSGVTFTADGVSHSTPWSGTYSQGTSVSLVMPSVYSAGDVRYYWHEWSDGEPSSSRTIILDADTTVTGTYIGPYYELTVASSPISGIPFTVDGVSKTTSYSEWLYQGYYTIEMPATYNGYSWQHWLEDDDTNRVRTVLLTTSTTLTAVYAKPDFSISASPFPSPLSIPAGGSGKWTLTITSICGFSMPVQLDVSSLFGVHLSHPAEAIPPPDGSIEVALEASVDLWAPPGIYEVTVTGTFGILTHTLHILLSIEPPSPPEIASWKVTNLYETSSFDKFLGMLTSLVGYTIGCDFDVFVTDYHRVAKIRVKIPNWPSFDLVEVGPGHYRAKIRLGEYSLRNALYNAIQMFAKLQGYATFSTKDLPPWYEEPTLPYAAVTEITIIDTNTNIYQITRSKIGQELPERLPNFQDAFNTKALDWIGQGGTLFGEECPVDFLVTDASGRRAGALYQNGQFVGAVNEIPNAFYSGQDPDLQVIFIHLQFEDCTVQVIGRDAGTYALGVLTFQEQDSERFVAIDIPSSMSAVHNYTISWDALSLGEEGVTVQIDSDGDGVFEHTFTSDSELTQSEFLSQVAPPPPVGGIWVPVNKFALLAPWIGLASLISIATVFLVYVRHRKKKRN